MARRDIDTYTVLIASFDSHEHVCEDSMVRSDDIVGLHALTEGNQVVIGSGVGLSGR